MIDRLEKIRDNRIKVFNLFQDEELTNISTAKQTTRVTLQQVKFFKSKNTTSINTSNNALSNSMMRNFKSSVSISKKDKNITSNFFNREVNPFLNKSPFKFTSSIKMIPCTESPITNRIATKKSTQKGSENFTVHYSLEELPVFEKKETKKIKPLTPKTKSGQTFFNNFFVEVGKTLVDNINTSMVAVTKDKIPRKLNVIDCLAMDNYDRIYNNFYKYAKILKFDKGNIQQNYSNYFKNKFSLEKSTLEDLYSKDLIISNKFIKHQEKTSCCSLPPIKRKIEDYKTKKPKFHYTFNKLKVKLKSSTQL
jgi:hypothetical protein